MTTTKDISFWLFPSAEPMPKGGMQSELAVFGRERSPEDVLTPKPMSLLWHMLMPRAPNLQPRKAGGLLLDESRLLLRGLGSKQGTLHAVPTSNGWVCVVLSEGLGAAQCARNFSKEGLVLAASQNEEGLAVYGLARNDVDAIEVLIGENAIWPVFGNNGFFLQLQLPDAKRVSSLTVRRSSGKKQTMELDFYHRESSGRKLA